MVRLQFLGTCAGIPSKNRNVSSLIIQMLQYKNECWMFDCGEGTQHQLLHSSFTLGKITKIFITHLHGDHIYGLPGVIGSRSFQGATEKLEIFGPKGLKQFIMTTLEISSTYVKYPLVIHEINEGLFLENKHFSFEAIKLEHGISSFGYRIIEIDQHGSLDVIKLKAHGINTGPICKELKEGKKVTLKDGTMIDGKDYLGPLKKGKIIAIAGDTRQCHQIERLAKDATIFVHEATYLQKDQALAFEHFHSTAYEAAKIALKSGVKTLFLNHISSRYNDLTEELLNEAKVLFARTHIANDLDTYIIKQNGEIKKET